MNYSEFMQSTIECERCKWIGRGATMVSGESFGDGVDKECPVCGERWGYVGYHMSHEFEGDADPFERLAIRLLIGGRPTEGDQGNRMPRQPATTIFRLS